MSGLLKLLDLLASLMGRWLQQARKKEIQDAHDQNHADPQDRFAARFGSAVGRLPDAGSKQLPTSTAKPGVDGE
jgi:hypothetical protein